MTSLHSYYWKGCSPTRIQFRRITQGLFLRQEADIISDIQTNCGFHPPSRYLSWSSIMGTSSSSIP
jgi:hypothetical protein